MAAMTRAEAMPELQAVEISSTSRWAWWAN
jgi:hypothetical protein